MLEEVGRDVAYALRSLGRQPVFAAASIGVLALAIGGNTAVFSLVDATLLRDLPYRDPGALVSVTHETPGAYSASLPFPLIQAFQREARGLSGLAAYYQNTGISRVTLTGDPEPETAKAGFVEAELFRVLGVAPTLGRVFTQAEETNQDRVAVLSHRLWQRRFDGSAAAVGDAIEIDGARTLVLGVMPPTFEFPDRSVELWVPLTTNGTWRREAVAQARYWWIAVGRLASGRRPAAVETELNAIAVAAGSEPRVERIRVRALEAGVSSVSRLTLLTLFGAMGALLLIACSNLATLLLARGEARRRELALRAAIGAGRARLVRQLVTESLALAALAGALGAFVALVLVQLFLDFGPGDVPRLDQAGVNARALVFLSGCSVCTALFFGLLPAFRSTDALHASSREAVGDARTGRLRTAFASLQLALAVVLLSAAGLLIRSFVAARSVELGFEPERTLVVRARLPLDNEPTPRRIAYHDQVLERLRAVAGVVAAGAINDLFETGAPRSLTLRAIEGREVPSAPLPLKWTSVAGDYFRAMGAPLLEGRAFDDRDGAASPSVVVVDQSFARRFFPGESVLGKRIKGNDARGKDDEWLTIVGVVADMRREGLERRPTAHVFQWARQSGEATRDLLVRTSSDSRAMAATVRAVVRGADATAIVTSVTTLQGELDRQLESRRFHGAIITSFALLALGLAGLGMFGTVHYAVSRRTREVGVRLALGATAADVVSLFLRQVSGPVLTGAVGGSIAALGVARALASLLFGVSPLDPWTHAGALTTLSLVVVLASLIPALRATRVDPLLALRQD